MQHHFANYPLVIHSLARYRTVMLSHDLPHQPASVVWFKRDLRVSDHAMLCAAARSGLPVVPLYVVEPGLWQQADASARQFEFLRECLIELREMLAECGQPLIIRTGNAVDILARLHRRHPISTIFAHEETGNDWTFARDRAVQQWARDAHVPFIEEPQNGVIRRIKTRDGWARNWDAMMSQPQHPVPALMPMPTIDIGPIPTASDIGLAADICDGRQTGGRKAALTRLGQFLTTDGLPYRRAMSSPSLGAKHCSRMSPHLAFGTISTREMAQATYGRMLEAKQSNNPESSQWQAAMVSLAGRLHWRDHFMQKLEDQPNIEFQTLHPAFRQHDIDRDYDDAFTAWKTGCTGIPFIDACMRSLIATGWLNFRMRAMLMSFASHLLNLPWRQTGLHLARQFTDYEPGIHWSQVQMQSGTTGINTVRIYNPVKQGIEHDQAGLFIRRWVPELRDASLAFLHNPWMADNLLETPNPNYPTPIIDVTLAMRAARERLHAPRHGSAFHAAADAIQSKHGSRKAGLKHTDKMLFAKQKEQSARKATRTKPAQAQDDLFN